MIRSLENELNIAKELAFNKLANLHHDRYTHTLGVVDKVIEIVKDDDVLLLKAKIAAYMHDIFKYSTDNDLEILTEQDKKDLEQYPFLLHAILASRYYLLHVGKDEEIYEAIRYHITSKKNSSKVLEILYIADFIEDNRTYSNCIKARMMFNKDFYYSTLFFISKSIVSYTKSSNLKPSIDQEEALSYYYDLAAVERNNLIITALDKVRASDITITKLDEDPFCDYRIDATCTSISQVNGFYDQLEMILLDSPYDILKQDGLNTEWIVLDISGTIVSLKRGDIVTF